MAKTKIETIYSDDDIIVINKPSGISVTADRSGIASLLEVMREQFGDQSNFKLVHRLDKFTSGVMILAKNTETQSRLSRNFENRQMRKTYLALSSGYAGHDQGQIKLPLAQSRKKASVMVVSTRRGKEAVTQWRRLADFGSISLLAVQPVTGRTHQIRVHLKNIGLPLAIDPVYGGSRAIFLSDFKSNYRKSKGHDEKPLMERMTLHAYELELLTPLADKPCRFVAGLGRKFTATIKMLSKHNANGPKAFRDERDLDKILAGQSLNEEQTAEVGGVLS